MNYPWAITHLIKRRMILCKFIRSYSQSYTNQKSANLIRKEFVDYFSKDLNHSIIRSSPVFPIADQSLAFVNAGMNQFKGIFLDYYKPPVTRAVNSQKCIRIGGKHNDLSIVGNDTYHHTLFEMLGNWSFGDYFKEKACLYAWDLLINVYGVPKECLYVTYFGGDKELGIDPDLECKDIWQRLGIPECRILSFGMQENFWEMGMSGPCGPCTEIHVDYAKHSKNQATRVNKGYADLMELWNIVFIQYERLPNGCIVPLSKHHVDTGMGLERLVALLQGKKSNYDTDLFQPLFDAIQKHSKMPEYKGTFGDDSTGKIDYGYRILADHARMVTVALADNMLPEQHPRLRKILRNAIDIGEKIFKKPGLLAELAYNVTDNLGDAYPELHDNLKKVQRIIEFEGDLLKRLQNTFGQMWNKLIQNRPELASITDWTSPGLYDGYKDLQSLLKELRETNILPGNVAFKLYDTYGLNLETIAQLAKIESLYFDENDFKSELDNRKYQSKIGLDKYTALLTRESMTILKEAHVPKTDDSFKYNYMFDGCNYTFPALESKLIGLIINGRLVLNENYFNVTKAVNANNKTNININEILNDTDEIGIILDRTSCYSLEGGQISDKGNIRIKNLFFNIHNVRKVNDYVIHFGYFAKTDLPILELCLQVADDCLVNIEPETRIGTMKHHTAAHLLNAAIKQVMQVVYQCGCTINSDSLKFQFNSFGQGLTLQQIEIIEDCINNVIQSHVPVTLQTLNSLELLNQDDITLIPGEIYPYTDIRVIEIITDYLKTKEACCGTHVHNTSDLQYFCILTYTSKGATRRTIKAVVGPRALSMKEASKKMWQKIMQLENNLHSNTFTYPVFNDKIKQVKKEINDQNRETPLPYLIKEKYLANLENLSKAAWLRQKENEKSSITYEITNATDSSLCFIVHCLNRNPTCLSLHEVVSLFSEVPVLVLSCTNGFVKARCSIPQDIVSTAFNAQMWMEVVLKVFNAQHGSIKGFKPMLVASMKSVEISDDCLQIYIKKALIEATKFISAHIKKTESTNSRNR